MTARILFIVVLLLGSTIAAESAPNKDKRAGTTSADKAIAQPAMVAPPRSTADITEILEKEKPDEARIAKLAAEADATPPARLSGTGLADFYYSRAQSAVLIGRLDQSIADSLAAIREGRGADYEIFTSRVEQFLAKRYSEKQDYRPVMRILQKQRAAFSGSASLRGRLVQLNLFEANIAMAMGDVDRAEGFVNKNHDMAREIRGWPAAAFTIYHDILLAQVDDGDARIAVARGRLSDAVPRFQKALVQYAASLPYRPQWKSKPAPGDIERAIDLLRAIEGRAMVRQGHISEGEIEIRRSLLSQLAKSGKYHADTAVILGHLVYVVEEQGRYQEAEKLQRQAIGIYEGLKFPADSPPLVTAYFGLAQIQDEQRHFDEASRTYDQIDKWTANWPPSRRDQVSGGVSRVPVLLSRGDGQTALTIAQRGFDRERSISGESSINTAVWRGHLGAALAQSGKDGEAIAAFQKAIPVLLSAANGIDDDSGNTAAAREARIRFVIESYLHLVTVNPAIASKAPAEDTLGFADALRGQSVQRALQASSVRATAGAPELAALVRSLQDNEKEIGASLAALNNLLALPASERDATVVKKTQDQVSALQTAHNQLAKDIAKRFPSYGSLVNPPLPSAADIRAALSDEEALLSFYFGQSDGFVWVVRKNGPVALVRLSMSQGDINADVAKLREALEPNASMISDIPPFDLKLAHSLYARLLEPVESQWKPAKSLIVITNSALGLLPLSVLPTTDAQLDAIDDPLFANYRKVSWLARTHAVTYVPSLSSLLTLRRLPASNPSRQQFIAFGDPVFNTAAIRGEQPSEIGVEPNTMRGIPLRRRNSVQVEASLSAQLSDLPPLPDTSDELKSIAVALQADPAKVLFLHEQANEQTVKTMNLSGFKIVAFATHGLAAGDLDGLTQPALALSSPAASRSGGDGLLTMEEILSLKLDADWVVLSACNTAAGSSAGADAASGLGRAFFYAGTRAILVTNWSVHSQSAKDLVTDLFKRQADDPKLTRGEALRQAMMALVDSPGYVGADGKTEFAYAHPLFWAPYSIIGDGGAR